jgi:putative selenium metabolism hydrolase
MTISSTSARTREQAELDLARDLIRMYSPSGQERDAAALLCRAFTQLGFDDAYLDDAGNAIGVLQRGSGPTVMLNGHLDTVPAGDRSDWQFDPYGAEVADGRLWGRGAVDMKGAVAAMTLAAADAVARGFSGTLLVTGAVQEEVGGLGSRFLAGQHRPDVIILGEPSNLELKLGHRGRVEVEVTLPGSIAHAAKAGLGRNALYEASAFLTALQQLELPAGGPLGASTATPTRLRSFPDGKNVVPGLAEIIVDYRNIPGDDPESILQRLQQLAPAAQLSVHQENATSENGLVSVSYPQICPPYLVDVQHPAVATARAVLQRVLPDDGFGFSEGVWWFATDAPYLAETGAPVLGFGPGDPELAHTTREQVPVVQLAAARRAYTELVLAFQ